MLLFVSSLLGAALAGSLPVYSDYCITWCAVDFSTYVTSSTFTCMMKSGISISFLRGYSPDGGGTFDSNVVPTIRNAYAVGMRTEVYMTLLPNSNKTAAQQFDELLNGLINQGITVRTIWFQVTSSENWGPNASDNKEFISSLIARAQNRAVTPGIYSNYIEWNQITGNWSTVPSGAMVWYWNVNGSGTSGETPFNFSDYVPFGGFLSPIVKQYGQMESICSTTVNKNIYNGNQILEALPKTSDNRIVVGGFIAI